MSESPLPEDYQRLKRASPFNALTGPYYTKDEGEAGEARLGLRIEKQHLNSLGVAHGGALMTLADNAIGTALVAGSEEPVPAVTVTLNSEFMSPAREGDWVEAYARILKKGRRLVFVDCLLSVQDRPVLHASAVMSRVNTQR